MKKVGLGCLTIIVILLFTGCVGAVLFSGVEETEDSEGGDTVTEEDVTEEDVEETDEGEGNDVPREWESALRSAETYSDTMNMSKDAIYEQLTSEFDQFPEDAAQYAVDNVDADWNQNALESAKNYQDTMEMSKGAIYDQLISQFDQFTEEQAQYAVDNLE